MVAPPTFIRPPSSTAESGQKLQLFVQKNGALQGSPPPCEAQVGTGGHGEFSLTYLFDQDTYIGSAIAATCWLDSRSAERGGFVATLKHRFPRSKSQFADANRTLPCITGYTKTGSGRPASSRTRVTAAVIKTMVKLNIVTRPTCFKAGDVLVLTITLVGPKGSDTVMPGVLFVGGTTGSVIAFEVTSLLSGTLGQNQGAKNV